MRNGLFIALMWLSLWLVPAAAQVSIGINIQAYPELDRVPGYPVYYAPQMNSNYFFYDGMYWVYQDDNWYASSWYNGPWWLTSPDEVPLFVLRVPVGYYREPPAYFRGWQSNSPPHWGEHWGSGWTEQRRGWDRWNRNSAPAPAPLPAYQRQYSGDRYPGADQQQTLRNQNYRYQPREAVVRQHFKAPPPQAAPAAPLGRPDAPPRPARAESPAGNQLKAAPPPVPGAVPMVPERKRPPIQDAKPQPQQESGQRNMPQQHEAIQPKPQPREAVQQPKPQPRQHEAIQQPKADPQPAKAPPPQAAPVRQQQPEAKPRGPEAGPQGQGQWPARGGSGGQPPAPEKDRGKPAERGQEQNQ